MALPKPIHAAPAEFIHSLGAKDDHRAPKTIRSLDSDWENLSYAVLMETSVTWLERLVDAPTGADWQELVNDYSGLLRLWCARAGVPGDDRDDLIQEVLLVVVRRVHEFERQRPGSFHAWLRTILANRLKKYFRDHRDHVCLIRLDDVSDSGSTLSKLFDREHDRFLARKAMQVVERDFSPVTWAAFREQVLLERSPQDVAAELNISLNAAIKAKSRVLKRLREALRVLDESS